MKLTLQMKLIAAALATAITITVILTWLSYSELRHSQNSAIRSEINAQASSFSRYLEAWSVDRLNIMQGMAHAFEKHIAENGSLDHQKALDILNQGRESANFGVDYIGLEDGTMYRHHPDLDKGKPDYDPRVRGWYKGTKSAMDQIITRPYIAVTGNKLAITFTAPVMKDNQLYGVTGGTFYLETIIADVLDMKVLGQGYAMLIDRQGVISAHPNEDFILKNASDLNPQMSAEFMNSDRVNSKLVDFDIGGKDTKVFFKPIPSTNWVLALVMNNNVLTQPMKSLLAQLLISAAVVLVLTWGGLIFLIRWLLRDMKVVSAALQKIASGGGDLTMRIETKATDEIGELATNFNRFVEFMHGIVSRLNRVGEDLVTESTSMQELSSRSAGSISTQQSEIEMVATAVNEMTQATQEIAGNAANAAATSQETVNLSMDGREQVRKSQTSINKLAEEVGRTSAQIEALDNHVQEITSIVSTISGIAEQTNLLALNAAIEAARAGEQGRGFAVVADEVRVLSQRTHSSTEEIHRMITVLQEATKGAVGSMEMSRELTGTSVADAEQASLRLDEIRQAVHTISDMAGQIATAAEEQTSVTREINQNTNAINDSAGEMATIVKQSAQQAESLHGISEKMKADISRFII
ncbi:MAG: hypothetical protein CMI02_14800 [Oceanospirillaceae bacterium]|nr:hypothetical protein [Oceanospirillaceae bacterium]MBT13292.1 hypothetical protein [Oceanospirillaceae bacterium]|tara:strand:+ start:30232 stop:32148 length:1917 start_codon:yes stop_codon:yes gene_type:complete